MTAPAPTTPPSSATASPPPAPAYASGHYTQSEGTNTSPLAIAPVSVLVDGDESTDTVTASITSTPANGTHYVAGETITTRLCGLAPLGSGAVHTNQMRLTVDGVGRRAGSTSSFRTRMTEISFAYTVTAADFDADGIAIPANSIVGGTWTERQDRSQSGPINFANRNRRALSDQSAHKAASRGCGTKDGGPPRFVGCRRRRHGAAGGGAGLRVRGVGGTGVMTPHVGFGCEEGGARRYRLRTRSEFGPDLASPSVSRPNARKAPPTPSTAPASTCG